MSATPSSPGYAQVTVRRNSDNSIQVRYEDAAGALTATTYPPGLTPKAMADALAQLGRLFAALP